MHEISQNIFPICAFGRAENLFYHSKGSLLREDLSLERILKDLLSEEAPLFPSHLLDRPDWEELVTGLRAKSPRLLIALGREWEELGPRALEAQRQGWGLDILVDRPLEHLQVPEELRSLTNVRWVVSPLRYYNPVHIVRSLEGIAPLSRILLCFLEPAKTHGLLPNMDELMLGRMQIAEESELEANLGLLVLKYPAAAPPVFFQNPTLEKYQESFKPSGERNSPRSILGSFFRTFPLLSLILVSLLSATFTEGRFKAPPSRMLHSLRWKVLGFFAGLRLGGIHLYWRLRSGFARVFGFVFWPLRKIYWVLEYQIQTRILPLLQKARRK